eukprot:2142259-Pyramimonas_sp.AAC.1
MAPPRTRRGQPPRALQGGGDLLSDPELTSLELIPIPEIDKPNGDDNLRDAPSEARGVLKMGIE